jgi:hypothetical protein
VKHRGLDVRDDDAVQKFENPSLDEVRPIDPASGVLFPPAEDPR